MRSSGSFKRAQSWSGMVGRYLSRRVSAAQLAGPVASLCLTKALVKHSFLPLSIVRIVHLYLRKLSLSSVTLGRPKECQFVQEHTQRPSVGDQTMKGHG